MTDLVDSAALKTYEQAHGVDLHHDPELERAYTQLLEQVSDLWEWRYRRRLAELRNRKSDDWLGGSHVPSMIWGGIAMLCRWREELWDLQISPWEVKQDAEAAAYAAFLEEVRNA